MKDFKKTFFDGLKIGFIVGGLYGTIATIG